MMFGQQALRGTVDHLRRVREGEWSVVDFKTDAPSKGGREASLDEHGDQVRTYYSALGKTLNVDVHGDLYFTVGGTEVEVPERSNFDEELRKRMVDCIELVGRPKSL